MDWLSVVRFVVPCTGAFVLCTGSLLSAQQFSSNPTGAQDRMRPIGSPSAVDSIVAGQNNRRTFDPSVQRVTRMQIPVDSQPMAPPSLPPQGFSFPNNAPAPLNSQTPPPSRGGFGLPSNGLPAPPQSTAPVGPIALPPSVPSQPLPQTSPPISPSLPATSMPPITTMPPATTLPSNAGPINASPISPAPRVIPSQSLPINPNVSSQPLRPRVVNPPSASDYAAIPQPQLDNAFATMDNCRNVTGPSTYRAAGFFGCNQPASYTSPVYGPPVYGAPVTGPPTTYTPPPSQVAPAIALPPGATYSPIGLAGSVPPVLPGSPGYRPLFTLGQERNPVQVGQGFWGQPVAYVPGQTLRNGLRYLSF